MIQNDDEVLERREILPDDHPPENPSINLFPTNRRRKRRRKRSICTTVQTHPTNCKERFVGFVLSVKCCASPVQDQRNRRLKNSSPCSHTSHAILTLIPQSKSTSSWTVKCDSEMFDGSGSRMGVAFFFTFTVMYRILPTSIPR